MSYRSGGTVRGPLRFNATSSPGLSAAAEGRIYFDSGTNTFMVSQNGGAYVDLSSPASAGGWTDTGTAVVLTTASDQVGIGTPPNLTRKLDVLGDATFLNIAFTSGNPGGALTGGSVTATAGQGGLTGTGGLLFLVAGAGGSTSGGGGTAYLIGGASVNASAAGPVFVLGGDTTGSG